jgi:hypothetical protein
VTGKGIERRLRAMRDPFIAEHHLRCFKCGPGQYGEGDAFLGIMVPALRKLSRRPSNSGGARPSFFAFPLWGRTRVGPGLRFSRSRSANIEK